MTLKAEHKNPQVLKELIDIAKGERPAEICFKGGHFLDVFSGEFIKGDVAVHHGVVVGTMESYEAKEVVDISGKYIVPGFIDSHTHIESSLMSPVRFEEAVMPCGTTTVIWDPHEIANVKGVEGIQWALDATEDLSLDVFVMVPSCVPSTSPELSLETSGAHLTEKDLTPFQGHERVLGLAEMMNYPGLLSSDEDVINKLVSFSGMRRDGHCPGLEGKELNAYAVAGIHSCHESTTLKEASEKLSKGIHVLIREGSCAKDAKTLLPMLGAKNALSIGMCSDDRNPSDIASEGHIDYILNMGLKDGLSAEDLFRAASYSAAKMYGLDDRGAIAPGYLADFAVVEKKASGWDGGFLVDQVYKNGRLIKKDQLASRKEALPPWKGKNINLAPVTKDDIAIKAQKSADPFQLTHVIGLIPNKLLTDHLKMEVRVESGHLLADIEKDILKITVMERHHGKGYKTTGFVRGFQLQKGAIASSINHDCHNVIAVGASDKDIVTAINKLIDIDGGIVVVDQVGECHSLSLPIGGLMTSIAPEEIAETLFVLKRVMKECGCPLSEPFLQLAFLALPVIPDLKISDLGLIDVSKFKKIGLYAGL